MSVPTLADCCLKSIQHAPRFRTTEGLLSIYAKLDSGNPQYAHVRAFARRALQERYPMLLERFGMEEMKLIFEEGDLELFERERRKGLEVKKVFSSLKGTVVEPPVVHVEARSDGTYPLEVLIQGAAWPPGIDCSKREQYLCDADFERVFQMTKKVFAEKDKHMRMRLKKENRLF